MTLILTMSEAGNLKLGTQVPNGMYNYKNKLTLEVRTYVGRLSFEEVIFTLNENRSS